MQDETSSVQACPACLPLETAGEGETVGCLGRISYPVEAQFEKFLADRVQLALDTLTRKTSRDCYAFSSMRNRLSTAKGRRNCDASRPHRG